MFIVINNMKELNDFLKSAGIVRPDKIINVLSDKNIVVSHGVAQTLLKAA